MLKYTTILSLAAGPALAHPGAHMHPHSVEGWVIGLGLLACALALVAVIRGRGRK